MIIQSNCIFLLIFIYENLPRKNLRLCEAILIKFFIFHLNWKRFRDKNICLTEIIIILVFDKFNVITCLYFHRITLISYYFHQWFCVINNCVTPSINWNSAIVFTYYHNEFLASFDKITTILIFADVNCILVKYCFWI